MDNITDDYLNSFQYYMGNDFIPTRVKLEPLTGLDLEETLVCINDINLNLLHPRNIHKPNITTWQAAFVLCRYAMDQKIFENKTILELGAGVGFSSMVACKNNAKSVIVTDQTYDLDVIKENLRINLTVEEREKASVQSLHFGKPFDHIQPEVIIGTDVTQDMELDEPIETTLLMMSNLDTEIYLAESNCNSRRLKLLNAVYNHFAASLVYVDAITRACVFRLKRLSK